MRSQLIRTFNIIMVLTLAVFLAYAFIHSDNFSNADDYPNTYTKDKAENCEAQSVKDLVIQIFKENDEYYKDIAQSSIGDISLIYPAVSSYDKEIDKYSCTGVIVMTSSGNAFLPRLYKNNNNYYRMTVDWQHYGELKAYNTLKVDVEYESQISEGKQLVRSAQYNDKFSCEGYCHSITDMGYVQEKKDLEKKQLEHQAKIQRDEHVVLPD